MQDGEQDALPLPIVGGNAAAIAIVENKTIMATAIAALILAGSAIVYRTRSNASSSSTREEQARPTTKVLASPNNEGEYEDGATMEVRGMSADQDDISDLTSTGLSKSAGDGEGKEGKSSRPKDRRRRGKDPLKEILKGGKKLKALSTTSSSGSPKLPLSTPKANHRGNDDLDATSPASPASSATSLLPPDTLSGKPSVDSLHGSLSRRTGKQAERRIIASNLMGSDDGVGLGGITSASEITEILQSHTEGFSLEESLTLPASTFSHSYSEVHVANHPYSHQNHHMQDPTYDRPPSPLTSASDDGGDMTMSQSSTSSRSQSRHAEEMHGSEGHQSPKIENQARGGLGLANVEACEDVQQSSSYTITSAVISPLVDEFATSSSTARYSNPSSGSSSVSTETTNTVASSSATRATSPTLSISSGSSKLTPTPTTVDTAETTPNASESLTPQNQKPSSTMPTPSIKPSTTPSTSSTKNKNNSRKAQQAQSGTGANNGKLKSAAPSPWDWDGAADAGLVSSSSLVVPSLENSGREERDKDAPKEKEVYKKPPRLQTRGSGYSSFSAAASGGLLTPSATHSGVLHSPTGSNFVTSPGSGSIPSSASATVTESRRPSVSPNFSPSAQVQEDEAGKDDEGFTFPTLNPPTINVAMDAGLTRARSSLGDITSPTSSTRGKNSRRPPTPSLNSTTPPSASTSSNSSLSQQANDGGNAGMPALSVQTQLASLRGALEAARLREEKNKADMERFTKEMELLRWENANCRRGEAELQTHVRHLMHQLHTYASLFASMTPQLNAHFQQQLQQQRQQPPVPPHNVISDPVDAASRPSSPDGFPAKSGSASEAPSTPQQVSHVSSSSTPSAPSTSTGQSQSQSQVLQQQQTPVPPPLPLHLPMHVNGIATPGGAISPMSPVIPMPPLGFHPGSPSPFFPYVMPPYPHALPPPPLLLQQMQQLQRMQQFAPQSPTLGQGLASPQQPNLFSMFPMGPPTPAMMSPPQYPQPFGLQQPPLGGMGTSNSLSSIANNGPRPSSAAGTSSAGSASPDLESSSSPGALSRKMGKKTRTQTVKQRVSGRALWEDLSDGWIGANNSGDGAMDGLDADAERQAVGADADDEDGDSESGFNAVLADAIFKRPDSLRVRASLKKGTAESEGGSVQETLTGDMAAMDNEQPAEFTYPSLSDLGNVYYRTPSRTASTDHSISSSLSSPPPSTPSAPAELAVDLQVVDNAAIPVQDDLMPAAIPSLEAGTTLHKDSDATKTEPPMKLNPTLDLEEPRQSSLEELQEPDAVTSTV